MMQNKPEISIIVSVYNAESTLIRCLESLVYQSLKNIEIIIVDKASTDRSREIAELYQAHFPEKVRFFERPYSENLSAAYNFAIWQAKAEYLAFADADDWYELNAMEVIYRELCKESVDIIHYPWCVWSSDGHRKRVSRLPSENTLEAQLSSVQMCTFWCRVIRKSLLCKYLPIPEVDGLDVCFLPVVISNASSIASINIALYNYVEGIGISNNVLSRTVISLIDGWNYLISHCNPNYVNYIIPLLAPRIELAVRKFWIYKWEYIAWLKLHKDLFLDNVYLKENVRIYQKIKDLIQIEVTLIPQIVYINGFGKNNSEARKREIETDAFWLDEGRVVVLDEKTCNYEENVYLKIAYQKGEYEYLGHYFALKNIFQTGGFFVGDQIHFTATLAPVLDKPSVFSFITTKTFSSEIWGARPGNEVIKELLNTYEIPDFYEDSYYPLSERIRNILVARFDVPLNGREQKKKDTYFIADARMFVLNDKSSPFVCEHDFSAYVEQCGYKVIPINIALPNNLTADQGIRQLTQERDKLKRDLAKIHNSDSWKLIKRLKKFANSPVGYPFKRLFKKMLRIYRKIKYDM